MNSKNDIKAKIQVRFHSESEACIFALTQLSFDEKGHCYAANTKSNFPKSICELEIEDDKHYIICPTWLLDKQKIKYTDEDKI